MNVKTYKNEISAVSADLDAPALMILVFEYPELCAGLLCGPLKAAASLNNRDV